MAKKILVVDDDLQFAMYIVKRLMANDYKVDVATDAIQAVAKVHKIKPDLILLDNRLPGGSGLKVLDNLKHCAETMTIPVIMITAYPSEEILREALEKGACDFVSKPFDSQDLLAKIKKALGEKEES